jgi:hypothetical protein
MAGQPEHTIINGGVGNRLFITANLYSHKAPYCVCNANLNNPHSTIPYTTTLFRNFNTTCSGVRGVTSLLHQDYKAIANILPEFIEKLHINEEPEVDAAFLHIRGGDYIGHPVHFIPLDIYYARAIRHFPPDTLFYIFTNDRTYAEKQTILHSIRYEFVECDELTALAKMKQCKRGGICANSSFSWWGAVLNMNRTLVIPSQLTHDPSWEAVVDYKFPGAIVEPVTLDVYCIHLAHRTDRLHHIRSMQARYPSLNIHLLDGIYDPVNGNRGCVLSHQKAARYAKDNKLPYMVVIEDDCDFMLPNDELVRSFATAIQHAQTVDVVSGCGNLVNFTVLDVQRIGDHFFLKSPNILTTHCVVYGPSSYDKVIAFHADTAIIDLAMNTTNFVYTYPYMARQLPGHSDILHQSVNYTNIDKSKAFVANYLAKLGT